MKIIDLVYFAAQLSIYLFTYLPECKFFALDIQSHEEENQRISGWSKKLLLQAQKYYWVQNLMSSFHRLSVSPKNKYKSHS